MKNVKISKAFIIPGLPSEEYAATADGKIISLKFGKQREMKQTLGTNGYYNVGLSFGNTKITKSVHSLVAATFVKNPNPRKNKIVNHLDRDRLNNSAKNLEWTDHKGNAVHASVTPKPKKKEKVSDDMANTVMKFLFDEVDYDTFNKVFSQVMK